MVLDVRGRHTPSMVPVMVPSLIVVEHVSPFHFKLQYCPCGHPCISVKPPAVISFTKQIVLAAVRTTQTPHKSSGADTPISPRLMVDVQFASRWDNEQYLPDGQPVNSSIKLVDTDVTLQIVLAAVRSTQTPHKSSVVEAPTFPRLIGDVQFSSKWDKEQ